MKKLLLENEKGSALVTLMAFMAAAILVTSASAAVSVITTQSISDNESSEEVLFIAESGMENAILRLLRDRTYSGETLSIGGGSAVVTVSGGPIYTITSVGSYNNFSRTVEVVGDLSNNEFSISSWSEI